MSAFLGNIHYLLYNKIKFQSDFCDYLLNVMKEMNIDDKIKLEVISNVEANTVNLKDGDLQDIVDLSNIHGSLQQMIIDVETKLAYIVDQIDRNEIMNIENISKIGFEFGVKNRLEGQHSPIDVYSMITGKILNGMPCDRVQTLLESEDSYVKWIDRIDIHENFWSDLGRSSDVFYQIRTEIIRGLISNIDVEFKELEEKVYMLFKVEN